MDFGPHNKILSKKYKETFSTHSIFIYIENILRTLESHANCSLLKFVSLIGSSLLEIGLALLLIRQ